MQTMHMHISNTAGHLQQDTSIHICRKHFRSFKPISIFGRHKAKHSKQHTRKSPEACAPEMNDSVPVVPYQPLQPGGPCLGEHLIPGSLGAINCFPPSKTLHSPGPPPTWAPTSLPFFLLGAANHSLLIINSILMQMPKRTSQSTRPPL